MQDQEQLTGADLKIILQLTEIYATSVTEQNFKHIMIESGVAEDKFNLNIINNISYSAEDTKDKRGIKLIKMNLEVQEREQLDDDQEDLLNILCTSDQ